MVDEWLGEKFNQKILWDVDSLAFRRTEWESVDVAGGLQMRKSAIKMWESVQSISYVTYSPNMFNTYIGYTGQENTVGDIASTYEGAMFAVNAGGFSNGKPADFLKLDGELINSNVSDNAQAIVGLTENPLGVEMKVSANVSEHSSYTSAIVAGHLLIRNGKEVDFSEETDEFYTTRMARTIVGVSTTGNYTLAVIDGGVAGQADGATVQEAAYIARMMGLNFAALLGSGDESTAWAPEAGVLNAPSAGAAAKIGSVIYLGEGTARVTGAGTADSPYLIENHVHMTQMRALCKAGTETFFQLADDVDMSEVKTWTPVNFDGDFSRKVYFDGNGKTISNFAPEAFLADDQATAAGYASMFGVLYGTVKDLTIKDAKVLMPLTQGTATGIIGGFLGTVQNSTSMPAVLENVHVINGEVSGGRDCGLFGGQARDASLKGCTAEGKVTGGNADCGGIIGRAAGHMSLEDCHSDAYLTAGQNPGSNFRYGGLIGFMATIGGTDTTRDDVIVKNCSSVGTFFNDQYGANTVGGLVGYINSSATISESFSTMSISGAQKNETVDAGGPVGGNHACCGGVAGIVSSVGSVTIINCWTGGDAEFATGQKAGGLVGVLEKGVLTIENCYSNYDMLSYSGAGGVFGQTKAGTLNIIKTFAWNPRVITYRAPDKYSSGAFAGCAATKCTFTGCFRNPNMEFVDPYRSLKEHTDITDGTPANDAAENPKNPTANNNAYDAQPSTEATLTAAAQKAGWSADIWDFSGDVPVLKNNK